MPAPPNLYLRTVSATPDGRILCSFGQAQPTTRLYDPASKTFQLPPETLAGVSEGVAWHGYFLSGGKAFRGPDFAPVDPPFPLPPADHGKWQVDEQLTTDTALFLRQENAIYRCAHGDEQLTLIADVDPRGGRLLASTHDGAVLGVRGQDYFVLKPGATDLTLRPLPVESGPRTAFVPDVDPQGRLWGGPTFGQTLFWMDPTSGEIANTSTISDFGGEVYDVAFVAGKVYAAAYAGGEIIEYDPAAPWDQWNHRNPRTIHRVGPAYIRPEGGIVTGPDGKLYSGWMAAYGTYGGAVAITDPASGNTDLLENPLGKQAISGVATDGQLLFVGTSLVGTACPASPARRRVSASSTCRRARWYSSGNSQVASQVGLLVYDAAHAARADVGRRAGSRLRRGSSRLGGQLACGHARGGRPSDRGARGRPRVLRQRLATD